jgi:superfamily I DNA and/or RNA helicase
MDPAIGTLVSDCFYDGELTNGRAPSDPVAPILFPKPVVWMNTAPLGTERRESRKATSFSNPAEARQIVDLLDKLSRLRPRAGRREPPLRVGILAGYAAQCSLIESMIAQKLAGWRNLDIEVGTVDAVQGRQFAVVIFSVTRSNDRGIQGHLADERRVNVALSRAQHQLVIVGDQPFVAAAPTEPLGRVVGHIRSHPSDCALIDADGVVE